MSIPPFDERGLLPPGDYAVTFQELRESVLVKGVGNVAWNEAWRRQLVAQAEIMVKQLWQVGIDEIYLDGSFAEDKPHPNDIDGYFVCDLFDVINGDLARWLNALDPYMVWTWDARSRKPYRNYPKAQLPMWHRYRVELFPHYGQSSGIRDENGNQLQFPAAFRKRRSTYEPKGIVKILKGGL